MFNIIADAILWLERLKMVERFPSQTLLDVRFYADNGVVVGTEADLVQGLLDEMMDAFAQMGVRVDHGKTKWMKVARSK